MSGYLKSKRTDRMNRRVHDGLAEIDRQTSYHVYDGENGYHGAFPSLSEARGCVEFDELTAYHIQFGDWHVVEAVSA